MGIRRVLAGAVLGLAGSALLALPAAAAAPASPYPPDPTPGGGLGTSTTNVASGGSVIISGNGFAAGATITINVTVVNGFKRVEIDAGPAPMGSLLAAGTTRAAGAAVQGFAAQTVTADASGAFSASVRLTQAGTNVITASGLDPNGNLRTLSTTVVVAGSGTGVGGDGTGGGTGSGSGSGDGSAGGVGGLPNTGTDLKVPVILGGALVLLGGGALVAGRRRKQGVAA